jgi:hypothetical protein
MAPRFLHHRRKLSNWRILPFTGSYRFDPRLLPRLAIPAFMGESIGIEPPLPMRFIDFALTRFRAIASCFPLLHVKHFLKERREVFRPLPFP